MAGEKEQIAELDERIETDEVDEGRRLWQGVIALVVLCVLVGALLAAVPGLRAVADRLSDVNPLQPGPAYVCGAALFRSQGAVVEVGQWCNEVTLQTGDVSVGTPGSSTPVPPAS